ncbi:MAG: winged helix DNA-binding domain-containing protein [Candidatus Dormibacteria bacterium]
MLRRRLTAQLLSGPPARSAAEVCRRLLAIQAQDRKGALLAIRARSRGLVAAAVEEDLNAPSRLLITWLNRGTLHLVTAEDYKWLHPLLGPRLQGVVRHRLFQEGVSGEMAERGLVALTHALADRGPMRSAQLGPSLVRAGLPDRPSAWLFLLFLASARGLVVRGPLVGRLAGYVLVRDWVGAPLRPEPERWLGELARRYLMGHGPADERDLAQWAGIGLGEARRGLRAISQELDQLPAGQLELRGRGEPAALPPPRLLGAFEPLLLGWRSRADVLGGHQGLITVNGLFRSMLLNRGRAQGTWTLSAGRLRLRPFTDLAPAVVKALEGETRAVSEFLGLGQTRLELEAQSPPAL